MAVPTFKKHAGPKTIFETVTNILRGDSVLKGLVGYDPKDPNIRRAFQPAGTWKNLVIYFMQPEVIVGDFSPNIRNVPLIVGLYVRENELLLNDLQERVVQLLDSQNGADLNKVGFVRVFSSIYDGELGSTTWDEGLKAWFKNIRFIVTFRKEG